MLTESLHLWIGSHHPNVVFGIPTSLTHELTILILELINQISKLLSTFCANKKWIENQFLNEAIYCIIVNSTNLVVSTVHRDGGVGGQYVPS
jgi:hypothetical protein